MRRSSPFVTQVSATTAPAQPRGCSNFKLRQADRLVSRHYDAYLGGLAGLKTSLRQTLHYHLGSARLRTRDVMIASQQLMERPPAAPTESEPAP